VERATSFHKDATDAERLFAIANTTRFQAIRYRRHDGNGGNARPVVGDGPTDLSTNRDAASDHAGGHTTRRLARRSVGVARSDILLPFPVGIRQFHRSSMTNAYWITTDATHGFSATCDACLAESERDIAD